MKKTSIVGELLREKNATIYVINMRKDEGYKVNIIQLLITIYAL